MTYPSRESRMSTIRRVTTLTATALIAAASFTGATAALGSAAEGAAKRALHGDYSGCTTPVLVSDVSIGGGQWEAEVAAVCTGYN